MTIRDIPSPQPSSREKHHHTIKAPSAGEGADRGEIKNLCSIQDKIVFKKTSGTLPNSTYIYLCPRGFLGVVIDLEVIDLVVVAGMGLVFLRRSSPVWR
jgi:hypothetical protein